MASHADAVREAKERFCALYAPYRVAAGPHAKGDCWDELCDLCEAGDAMLALVAQTCATCGGDGEHPDFDCGGTLCPAACDNGKRKEAAND